MTAGTAPYREATLASVPQTVVDLIAAFLSVQKTGRIELHVKHGSIQNAHVVESVDLRADAKCDVALLT